MQPLGLMFSLPLYAYLQLQPGSAAPSRLPLPFKDAQDNIMNANIFMVRFPPLTASRSTVAFITHIFDGEFGIAAHPAAPDARTDLLPTNQPALSFWGIAPGTTDNMYIDPGKFSQKGEKNGCASQYAIASCRASRIK